MPHAEVIRAQTTPEDGALFEVGLAHSKYMPQKHIAFTDDLKQRTPIGYPDTVSGSQLIFTFEKDCTLLGDVDILIQPPSLTVPANGTYIRYVDWLSLVLLKKVEWRYGANTLETYRPDFLFSDIQYMSDEQQYNEARILHGDRSAAARNTFAANTSQIRCKVPCTWRGLRYQSPLICGLANKLTLYVDLPQAQEIIQSDGTRPNQITFTNIQLIRENIHMTGGTRAEYVGLTMTPTGLSYLVKDIETYDYQIPANAFTVTGQQVIELRDLDGPISMLSCLVRTQAQLDPTTGTPDPFAIDTRYLEGLNYRISSNGMDIQDPENMSVDNFYKINKYFPCRGSTRQVTCLWTEFPTMENVAGGSVSFGNFQNPKLILSNPTLNGVHPALTVTVIARRWNWIVQQRGNIQKVWR